MLDWIDTNMRMQAQAKQDLVNTDYAFKLYNKAHPEDPIAPLREPKFSDYYTLSPQQKNGELAFVGLGALGLGYATFHFL